MSNKNKLKDKIKKPSATQSFLNSYDMGTLNQTKDKVDENKEANTFNNEGMEANADTEVESNQENVVNVKDNDDDYLRNLATGKKIPKEKKAKKVFTTFYLEPDLAAEVNKIAARGEKGDKSRLFNTAIRKLLEEYGVIGKNS